MNKKKLLKVIEDEGWSVESNYIETWCDNGKDIIVNYENLEDLPEILDNLYINYDSEEEFELYVEAKRNGLNGCPSYRDMLEDCEQEENLYRELYQAISAI